MSRVKGRPKHSRKGGVAAGESAERVWSTLTEAARTMDLTLDGRSAYIFRGQADVTWRLQTPLQRQVANVELSEVELLEIERRACEVFRRKAHNYLDQHVIDGLDDPLFLWSVMQHHGVATRLLDWTHSIYVAAYFAASQLPERDGVVFGLREDIVHRPSAVPVLPQPQTPTLLQRRDSRAWAPPPRYDRLALDEALRAGAFFTPGVEPRLFLLETTLETERMMSQQGVFLACTSVAADIQQVLGLAVEERVHRPAWGLRVPAAAKPYILNQLRLMNITAHSLFPGLDGLCKSISEAMFIEAHRVPPGADRSRPRLSPSPREAEELR